MHSFFYFFLSLFSIILCCFVVWFSLNTARAKEKLEEDCRITCDSTFFSFLLDLLFASSFILSLSLSFNTVNKSECTKHASAMNVSSWNVAIELLEIR